MPLTDKAVKNKKPSDKTERLSDEKGLYLEVSPTGGKWWRLKYRIEAKEKRISLGTYPEVSLQLARERRDDARKQVAEGIDPSALRKAEKAASLETNANLFEVLAREWFANTEGIYVSNTSNAEASLTDHMIELQNWIFYDDNR